MCLMSLPPRTAPQQNRATSSSAPAARRDAAQPREPSAPSNLGAFKRKAGQLEQPEQNTLASYLVHAIGDGSLNVSAACNIARAAVVDGLHSEGLKG